MPMTMQDMLHTRAPRVSHEAGADQRRSDTAHQPAHAQATARLNRVAGQLRAAGVSRAWIAALGPGRCWRQTVFLQTLPQPAAAGDIRTPQLRLAIAWALGWPAPVLLCQDGEPPSGALELDLRARAVET